MIVDALKYKVICDFNNVISNLEKGYVSNYENILLSILFLEYGDKDKRILEYLLNYAE